MDGWVDGWTDGPTDGWMDGWMDGKMCIDSGHHILWYTHDLCLTREGSGLRFADSGQKIRTKE